MRNTSKVIAALLSAGVLVGTTASATTAVTKTTKAAKTTKKVANPIASVATTVPPTTAVAATTTPAATAAPKSQKWPDKIVFAPVPSENATQANITWTPFVKGLEKELGIKIEQVNPSDYAGVIEAQLSGKVDLAMYGPFSYYLAKQAGAKIDAVAVAVSQIGVPATYQSYLVAKADSAISTIADVKGKKVCFVDTASTSGYLYPFAGLKEAGISLDNITPVYAGGHDKSAVAVKAGTCDAGFAYDDMVNILLPERGLVKAGELKIVWKSKGIPQSPIAVRTDLPDSLVAKIREVVPKLDALYFQANKMCPTGNPNCNLGGLNAWVQVNDKFFDPIAEVCKATSAPACIPAKK